MAGATPNDGFMPAGGSLDHDNLPPARSLPIDNPIAPDAEQLPAINTMGTAIREPRPDHAETVLTSQNLQENYSGVESIATTPPSSQPEISIAPFKTSTVSFAASGADEPTVTEHPLRITFEEYLILSEITFEWSESYDDKDWMRLRAILAPTLMVDYTEVNGYKWDNMPAAEFVSIMSNVGFVGDPLVHTQHHIGASKWQKVSDDEVIGHHQLRAAHQRYTSADLKTVENKGHGHAVVRHYYRRFRLPEDGERTGQRPGDEGWEWKLAGLRPTRLWAAPLTK